MMIPIALHVEPKQEKRIGKALKKRAGCRIKVIKGNAGTSRLLLAPRHLRRYNKASHGTTVSLPFRHEELMENMRHKGGFLPLIMAALAPIIGGIAGGFIEKEIAGSGLSRLSGKKPWWHGGGVMNREKKHPQLYTLQKSGSGLKLNPWIGQM